MNCLYFDHAATTPPCQSAKEAVMRTMNEIWGNPSSVHALGFSAEKAREEARFQILDLLGVRFPSPGQLIFTSSGTESDNLAILGTANAKNHGDNPRIITTDSEHPAVARPMEELEKRGFEIVRLSTKNGVISLDEVDHALSGNVVLVSIMTANNETGAIYDLKSVFSLVHRKCPRAVTHTDAVQAFGKIPVLPEKLGADLVSISAHKIGGIKGAGALYQSRDMIKRRILSPIVFGGGQESGMRSGTEALPAICAFGAAAKEAKETMRTVETAKALRSHLLALLDERVTVNQPAGDYLPTTISLTLPSIRSEIMLRYLSERGIYVSAGSACSAHHGAPSPILLAFGLTKEQADTTIRVTFSASQSTEDLTVFARTLSEGIDSLAKLRETRK